MKITVRTKLFGIAALSIGLALIIGVVGLWGVAQLDGSMDAITRNSVALRNHMTADMMHDALRSDVLAALVAAKNNRSDDRPEIIGDLNQHVQIFTESLNENAKLELGEEIKAGLAQTRPALESYIRSARTISELAFMDHDAAFRQLESFKGTFDRLAEEMESLSTLIEDGSLASQADGDRAVVIARNTIIGVSIAAIIVLLAGSLQLSRRITRPLQAMVEGARKIAGGDLTAVVRAESRDEIGDLATVMNDMREKLGAIVAGVRSGAGGITDAAQEIATGVNDLSQRTEEQASSLEETASSMEQMTSTVKQSADSTQQTSTLARAALQDAEQGGAIVTETVAAMSEISASSNRIADIIGVIDEIAFQTNLLALNAAVEAARAGEQGKGFAVVAAEVRSLAQRSAEAAREIKGLIEDGVSKVRTGSELVQRSGDTLQKIIASVSKVSDIAAELSAASHEQSAGIEQINKAVMQMDEMTQQNAALVEQASAASKAMEEQAQRLLEQIGFFRTGAAGAASAAPVESPAALRRRPSPGQGARSDVETPPAARRRAA